jgi:hypothetical protein
MADVNIILSWDASQLDAWPESLTFTPNNWKKDQIVTVIALDDGITEGDHHSTIGHSASSLGDPAYDGITVNSVIVNIAELIEVEIPKEGGEEPGPIEGGEKPASPGDEGNSLKSDNIAGCTCRLNESGDQGMLAIWFTVFFLALPLSLRMLFFKKTI